jgi:hypothetical protein
MIATRITRTGPDSTVFAIPSQSREVPLGLPPTRAAWTDYRAEVKIEGPYFLR